MTVKELIRKLEKMPEDAEVLVHVKELGGYQNVDLIKTTDGKSFVKDYGEIVVVLEEKPFVPIKEQHQEEEPENLCPDCNVAYCQGRYTTGQCE